MLLRPLHDVSPIHTRAARRETQHLVARRRLSWCEIYNPPKKQGGIVREKTKMQPLGRVRCAVTQSTKTAEIAPDGNTAASVIEYEIALPPNVRIDPSSRVFVPAKYRPWKPNQLHKAKDLVVSTQWENGKTMVFRCIRAGTSGSVEPDWPMQLQGRVVDGGVVWVAVFVATIYEVIAINSNESNTIETIVRAKEITS